MTTKMNVGWAAAIVLVAGLALNIPSWAQQSTPPATPPTPSGPRPATPAPPSQNPSPTQPRPAVPPTNSDTQRVTPNGSQPATNTPSTTQPRPATPPTNPDTQRVTPNGSPSALEIAAAARLQNQNQRPFTFQSPQAEVRFNQATGRIQQMEQRLEVSNTDLLKRLGEVRQLTGERQTTALFDLMQRVLQDRVQLHQYLVQSRAIWSGEMGSTAVPAEDQQQVDPNAPAEAPNSNQPQANPQNFPPR